MELMEILVDRYANVTNHAFHNLINSKDCANPAECLQKAINGTKIIMKELGVTVTDEFDVLMMKKIANMETPINHKCLNFQECGNYHKWDIPKFLDTKDYIDKIKICFCKDCETKSEHKIPRSYWISLVETFGKAPTND